MQYAVVIDRCCCTGCHARAVACKTQYQVPLAENRTWAKGVGRGTFPDTIGTCAMMQSGLGLALNKAGDLGISGVVGSPKVRTTLELRGLARDLPTPRRGLVGRSLPVAVV